MISILSSHSSIASLLARLQPSFRLQLSGLHCLTRTFTVSFAGNGVSGVHAKTFRDGAIILSDAQINRISVQLGFEANFTQSAGENPQVRSMRGFIGKMASRMKSATVYIPHTQPCAWNMLLSRRFEHVLTLWDLCYLDV